MERWFLDAKQGEGITVYFPKSKPSDNLGIIFVVLNSYLGCDFILLSFVSFPTAPRHNPFSWSQVSVTK